MQLFVTIVQHIHKETGASSLNSATIRRSLANNFASGSWQPLSVFQWRPQ
jgi:hypothetical protein